LGSGPWKALKTIAIVTSPCVRDGKETAEVRYYISSLAMDVKRLARAVRGHWGIENQLHWQLDVSFREDECRVCRDHAPANLSVIRRFALGLLKRETGCKKGVAIKRLKCAGSDEYREQALFNC
jgi:predicted transposase YbfD/YdcC